MSQVTDQQTTDAQFGVAVTLWDPELSWASQRSPNDTVDNRGCPPGYGTMYTANGKVCRLVSTATAETIQQDSAPGFADQTMINIAAASESVVGGAAQVVNAAGGGISWVLQQGSQTIATLLGPLAPWLIAGGLFYIWSVGGFQMGREATAVARSRIRAYHARGRARRRASSKGRKRR